MRLRWLPFVLACCTQMAGCPHRGDAPRARPSLLLRDVNVVDVKTGRVREHQCVSVVEGAVTAVTPVSTCESPPAAQVVDAAGKHVLPGLWDMHVHLRQPEEMALFLARGVTGVRNMLGSPLHLQWRSAVARGEQVGPRIITAGPLVDGDPPSRQGSLLLTRVETVDAVLDLHRKAGFDFIKVYSGLQPAVYAHLLERAHAQGFQVAGHVPWEAGLDAVLNAHQDSVEHLTGVLDAAQSEDSPLRGRVDRASREQKADHVDTSRFAPLARRSAASGTWHCPTRVVFTDLLPEPQLQGLLKSPSALLVPPFVRATWGPWGSPAPEEAARNARTLDLYDTFIRALHEAGAPVLAGSDTGNPFVVPGASLLDELDHLVRLGFTPAEALRVATVDAARFLGLRESTAGVAAGQRADLVLTDENPLNNMHTLRTPFAVVAHGRFLPRAELQQRLQEAVTRMAHGREHVWVEDVPVPPDALWAETFDVEWKGAWFGAERVVAHRPAPGALQLTAHAYDAESHLHLNAQWTGGPDGRGTSAHANHHGAMGDGHAEATFSGATIQASGQALNGMPSGSTVEAPGDAALTVDHSVMAPLVLAWRAHALEVGSPVSVAAHALTVGSRVTLPRTLWTVTRAADEPVSPGGPALRHVVMKPERGPKWEVWLQEDGRPERIRMNVFGDALEFRRRAEGRDGGTHP